MDMMSTIEPKSDQLTADDLIAGPRTITIARVNGNDGNPDQPVNFFFDGDGDRPYRPCKIMRRVVVSVWGPDAAQYVGRSMRLYRDPNVKWGGMTVGGVRISHMSHMEDGRERTLALTETRGKKTPHVVKPLAAAPETMPVAEQEAILVAADGAARSGTEAFKAWYKDQTPAAREVAKAEMAKFQKLATEADAAGSGGDDPFTAGQKDDGPAITQEDRERAAREAREAIQAQDREAAGQ